MNLGRLVEQLHTTTENTSSQNSTKNIGFQRKNYKLSIKSLNNKGLLNDIIKI
ncbi:MAG: hypothetical protein SCARUB_00174 [Candidatus Scalindua rubra]|uniref:Uncharacterized protein n=1 Tax=Candidatus Scalindua rubra TaxID=1872076 RepID=A0A1E3XGJ6_9BACT|nr:MAG: hypothetical protein SCARUB_00174 [Candidatus Scalindua rubra]